MFGNETPIWSGAAFHYSLGIVNKRIRQWITADVTHGKRLPFPQQDEVNTAGKTANCARLNRAPKTHAVRQVSTLQRLQFSDGVVVRLASAITQPCKECHDQDHHTDSDPKLHFFLHRLPPLSPP